MKYIKSFVALLFASATMLTSCDMGDFGDLNVDPNKPSEAYTSMMFLSSSRYARNFIMTSSIYDPWPMLWTGYLAESKNNQYGSLTTTVSFTTTNYYRYAIRNLNDIIEMNENESTKNEVAVLSFGDNANQVAAAKTLRAFFYMTLTDMLGPIPYSEAFKGESDDIWTPKFDSQESIYKSLDEELASAYTEFDESGSLSNYDIFYNGDIAKWKKLNASLRMMMAIKMSDVDATNGKARFAKAYSDGGMKDVEDGFNYTFDATYSYSWMYYVGNMEYAGKGVNFVPNKVFVDALKEYKDKRLFKYCTLDGYKGKVTVEYAEGDTDEQKLDKTFAAYKGVALGYSSNDEVTNNASGCCSVNSSYCEATATYGLISTARTLLVEAEAAELGWISADPKALYEAGIKASYKDLGADGIDEYLASEKVSLSSDKETALKQIVMQRFLAGFLTDGIEAWSDWRRYNIPTLPILNGHEAAGISVYPYRMGYSDTDKLYNADNAKAAIDTYLNGVDDRWQRVWWDTKDNK